MLACLSAFAALVAYNNLSDYDSNFAFVQHVLAMDTVFADSTARWRAIGQPLAWHLAYWLIIASELLVAGLLGRGAWALWRARRASPAEFSRARQSALWGVLAGFVLWFGGFMVVGGEWFLMWQSSQWNGQESAFRFYLTLLAVGIFVQQEDA
jgi:predicted small integral membrane protein